jgi:formylglycine-generating enzyme required for sulfatase activity/class 3 adenylate cyclase
MAEQRSERRLSAILAADIAGYSRLMGVDDARTVRDLKGHQAVVLPIVGDFGGRIIDTAGDGILAEFASVVNAIKCAVAIQSKMAERNVAIEPECRMQFRIGINIGDVIFDETRIFGDGINVAARLEGIADPGGICISSKVYDEISGRVDLTYLDIGEQQLKNIARPVRVYRVRLKQRLEDAGLDAKHFDWPPPSDPNRPPYRGLRPFEAEDAGIFFGREAPIMEALDCLRGMREGARSRLLVILGASGAGKSSFLRAGLLPRLARDDGNFMPLPIIRPERAAMFGETGLLFSLVRAFAAARVAIPRAELRTLVQGGAAKLKPLLQRLADRAGTPTPPALIVCVDQGEELFLAEGQNEARTFLALLRDLLSGDGPAIIAAFTIRSDSYERLQLADELEGMHQETLSLPPMPKGSYAEVVKGPAQRLEGSARAFQIEDALADALLVDIEAGGAKDALPLLAFTLERLYDEYQAGGHLRLAHYDALGRVKGSIEAAVERALKAADADPAIPKDRAARLALLRRGIIPWLAGIDPDTGAPRRRVARLSEIPAEARPLIQHLVEQRLLATDLDKASGESTIEPAHESLLRQLSVLKGWLTEDAGLLAVLEGVKRASRDWAANARDGAWLTHGTDRLAAADRLRARPDLAANLEATDRDYLAACRKAESATKSRRRRLQAAIYMLLIGVIAGLIGWINQAYLAEQWRWWSTDRPFAAGHIWPYVLETAAERALKPGDIFKECSVEQEKDYCPQMVVLPAGSFIMGSPATEPGHQPAEQPQHRVTITKPFAVSKFELTFDEWDTCVDYGDCPQGITDSEWGRGRQPVINVTWGDAQRYVAWLSKITGRRYRLLTEAEYEYAARSGSTAAYPWGDDIGQDNANCKGCGSRWDNAQTAPVGSFAANGFGLFDMAGNVWEWVEDCLNENYRGAPANGSAWIEGRDCKNRIVRGGSWQNTPDHLRSAARLAPSLGFRDNLLGFRIARTLNAP